MADGSIIIGTKLDNEPFVAGSKEFQDAVKSLVDTINSMGRELTKFGGEFAKTITNQSKDVSAMNEGMANMAQSAEAVADAQKATAEAAEKANAELDSEYKAYLKVGQAVSEAQRNQEQRAGINSEGAADEVEAITEAEAQMAAEIADSSEAASEHVESFAARFKAAMGSAAQASKTFASRMLKEPLVSQDAYDDVIANIEKTEQALERLKERENKMRGLGVSQNSAQWRSLQYDITKARDALEWYNSEKERMEKIGIAPDRTAENIEQVGASAKRTRPALAVLVTDIKKVAKELAKLSIKAVKTGLTKFSGLVKNASKALLGLNKAARSSNKGFNLSFKNILKYGLGIRSLFVLFNRLRSAITDGFGAIIKKNPELKAAINGLAKSFNALKGSLASAFAPVVTAIAPAVTQLINLLTEAMNTVAQFFAALTGKTTFQKSIGALGKEAKTSSKSVKDLNRQLASFDHLNILSEDNGSGTTSSKSDDSGLAYKTESISSSIRDFVEEMKKLWRDGDYEEIGRIIADGMNKAIQKVQDYIKWENVGPAITKVVNGVTGAINGFFDGINWTNLGATLGDRLNTITNTLKKWYEGIRWENIGASIAAALNGLINRINWRGLGKLVRLRIGSLIKTLKGAVTTFRWGDTGTKFAAMLNEFFKRDSLWKDASDTINGIVLGMLDFGKKFLEYFNAIQAAEDIKTALGGIKWREIASEFWKTVELAFSKAGSFLKVLFGGDVYDIQGDAVDQLWERGSGNASSKSYAVSFGATLGKALSDAIKTSLQVITDFINNEIPWGTIGDEIHNLLGSIDWIGIADAFWDAIVAGANGLGKTIVRAIFGSDSGIYKYLFPENAQPTKTTGGEGLLSLLGLKMGGNLLKSGLKGAATGGGGFGLGIGGWLSALGTTGVAGYKAGTKIYQDWYANGGKEIIEETGEILGEKIEDAAGVINSGKKYNSPYALAALLLGGSEGVEKEEARYQKELSQTLSSAEEAEQKALATQEAILKRLDERDGKGQGTSTAYNPEDAEGQAFAARIKFIADGGDLAGWDEVFKNWEPKANIDFIPAGVQNYVNKIPEYLKAQTQNPIEAKFKLISDKATSVAQAIQKVLGVSGDKATGTVSNAVNSGMSVIKRDVVSGMEATKEAANNVQWANVGTNIQTVLAGIGNNFKTQFNTVQGVVATAFAGIKTTAAVRLAEVAQAANTNMGAANRAIQRAVSATNSVVSTGFAQVRNSMVTQMQSAFQAVQNQRWSSLGSNIVSGINQGVASAWNTMKNTVVTATNNLIQAAKAALKIHSPSQVARDEIGLQFGLGWALGIIDSESEIMGAVADAADAAADGMMDSKISPYLSADGSGLLEGLDGVLDVFSDRVVNSFSGLVERLEAIARSASFRTPNVAAGVVLPYSVTGGNPNRQTSRATNNNDDLVKVLIQLVNNQTSALVDAIQRYSGPKVNIDKDSLADAIIDEINRRARAQGKSPILI